jgi:hypothetical protein
MSSEALMLLFAAVGATATIGTVVFLAGRMQGAVANQLQEIERRLGEIEGVLSRAGLNFRHHEKES